jgi:hypothetical protein
MITVHLNTSVKCLCNVLNKRCQPPITLRLPGKLSPHELLAGRTVRSRQQRTAGLMKRRLINLAITPISTLTIHHSTVFMVNMPTLYTHDLYCITEPVMRN